MTDAPRTSPIRVLVVDDDPLAREALREYIAAAGDLELVGTCADGAEAVAAVSADPPDVVLMDVRMPVLDGPAATRELVRLAPTVRVLALTTLDDDDAIARIFEAGGCGFLLKHTRPAALADAIRAAHSGVAVLPPDTMRRWTDARSRPAAPELTDRERAVLVGLGQGLTNRQIAQALFASASTIKIQVASLMRKLDAPTRTRVVARAHELGLLSGLDLRDGDPGPSPG